MELTRGLAAADGVFTTVAKLQAADLKADLTVAVNDGSTIQFYETSLTNAGTAVGLTNGLFANPVAGSPVKLWLTKINNFTAVSGELNQIDASLNIVDVIIPALASGDPFVFHNLVTSLFKVQILNPTETIKGKNGDIAAGVNMELLPGQSVQLVAKSSTILSITGALV